MHGGRLLETLPRASLSLEKNKIFPAVIALRPEITKFEGGVKF